MTVSASSDNMREAQIVTLDYSQLMDENVDLSAEIEQAFGPEGLGIIRVAGVPRVLQLRRRLLPLAQQFAALSDDVRVRYEDPVSLYNFGWSHGKEQLGLQPDFNKGSFYANPAEDAPTADEDLMRKFPAYCRPNIWPKDDLPELEPAFKELGRLMMEVGQQVTAHCDSLMARHKAIGGSHGRRTSAASPGPLQRILQRSPCAKGRLLHYYPPKGDNSADWCAWHQDHGSITGLTSAMYLRGSEEAACPDAAAGLHIRARDGSVVKATIGADQLAFQVGESMQVHSGGLLQATPHYVHACSGTAAACISRNTFAVFMQPRWDEPMEPPPDFSSREQINVGQWRPGMTFGQFAEATIANNYH